MVNRKHDAGMVVFEEYDDGATWTDPDFAAEVGDAAALFREREVNPRAESLAAAFATLRERETAEAVETKPSRPRRRPARDDTPGLFE